MYGQRTVCGSHQVCRIPFPNYEVFYNSDHTRQLDLVGVDTLDNLPELLPHLTSLVRLDLKAEKVDARLLAAVNSHSSLATVVVRDSELRGLVALVLSINLPFPQILASMDLSFSKIVVSTTTVDLPGLKSAGFRAVIQRGASFSCLGLHDEVNLDDAGTGSSLPVLPHLEQLHLNLSRNTYSIQNWLPSFARRHPHLRTIILADWYGRYWSRRSEAPFASDFVHALSREGITRVTLSSFSISRPASWTSLTDWDVVQLQINFGFARLLSATAFSAVVAATMMLAPQVSSLDLVLPDTIQPIHIVNLSTGLFDDIRTHFLSLQNDFANALGSLQSLRTLHLTNAYGYLHVNGQAPWAPSKREQRAARDARGTSTCITAFDAVRWYAGRVAQEAPALELVHITDAGRDGMGRFSSPWSLQASYRVRSVEARDLEMIGPPKLVIDPKHLPSS